MGEDIMTQDFDVFIAYHGTNDDKGSMQTAADVYSELSKNAKCFFMPISAPTRGFTDTPTIAKHSSLFVLVANDSIPLNDRGEIVTAGLYNEIDAFYKSHFNERPGEHARVYAYDGLTAKKADSFHVVFSGYPHFDDSVPDSLNKLIDWVKCSLPVKSVQVKGKEVPPPAPQKQVMRYEGMWVSTGEFSLFQGEEDSFTSVGRLMIQRSASGFKVLYCYGVSKEYTDQNCITAICDGIASVEMGADKSEVLTLTCDIIARTSAESLQSNKHFKMKLVPQSSDVMMTDFIKKKTRGRIIFTRS